MSQSDCNKRYYQANRERIIQRNKEWRKANKDTTAKNRKEYRAANSDKIKAMKKAYYEKNKETIKTKVKAWYRNNYAKVRAYGLSRYEGLTPERYAAMLSEQASVCAICNGTNKNKSLPLFVDHCHKTGKIRGLLCGTCNGGLGMFKDSVELVIKASLYLKKYQ